MKPTIGQTVYVRQNNRGKVTVKEAQLSKIGRRYYYVEFPPYSTEQRFDAETMWANALNPTDKLYFSMQEIELEDEYHQRYRLIVDAFGIVGHKYPRPTLDQLQRICAILSEGEGD